MEFESAKEFFYELDKKQKNRESDLENDPLYLEAVGKLLQRDELNICRNRQKHPVLQGYSESTL